MTDYARSTRVLRTPEIRKALNDSYQGRSGRNVFAQDSAGDWHRIISVKTHSERVLGKALNTGEWFPIQQWEER